ncbi:hypothetical protein [Yinghuangia sp. YIM S09857]
MACTTCKGKGSVRLPRRQILPGATAIRRRADRHAACPSCLGVPRA